MIGEHIASTIDRNRRIVRQRDGDDALEPVEIAGRSPRSILQRGGNGDEARVSASKIGGGAPCRADGVDHMTNADDAVKARLGVAEIIERQIGQLGPLPLQPRQRGSP